MLEVVLLVLLVLLLLLLCSDIVVTYGRYTNTTIQHYLLIRLLAQVRQTGARGGGKLSSAPPTSCIIGGKEGKMGKGNLYDTRWAAQTRSESERKQHTTTRRKRNRKGESRAPKHSGSRMESQGEEAALPAAPSATSTTMMPLAQMSACRLSLPYGRLCANTELRCCATLSGRGQPALSSLVRSARSSDVGVSDTRARATAHLFQGARPSSPLYDPSCRLLQDLVEESISY